MLRQQPVATLSKDTIELWWSVTVYLSLNQVADFHRIIQHYDERLAQYLNELYLQEEWSFAKEEFSKQKLPSEVPVSREFRMRNVGVQLAWTWYLVCSPVVTLSNPADEEK